MRTIALEEHYATQALPDAPTANRQFDLGLFPQMKAQLFDLDAVVQIKGSYGERAAPLVDFHLLPGDHPERETILAPGELITAVDLPALPFATRSLYLKMRDRASYAFPLVSVAAALDREDGTVKAARLALGGVGTKPWRAWEAEAALAGQPANEES